jgi:molybdate transport system substrate-binding protein
VYAPSQTLRDQIAQGAPVDVFLPSLLEEIDDLGKKSLLVEGGKRIYAGTSLVLITNSALPAPVGSIQDLETIPLRRLALGDPQTASVGKVAAQFITYTKLDKRLRPQYLYGENSRGVLDLVAAGEAELGLVYRTDAVSNKKVRIVDTIPPASHTKIQYGAGIAWSSRNISGARNFIDFLLTSRVQAQLQEHGFDRVDSGVGVASREEGK